MIFLNTMLVILWSISNSLGITHDPNYVYVYGMLLRVRSPRIFLKLAPDVFLDCFHFKLRLLSQPSGLSYVVTLFMRDIKKETSRRPRNRNQHLHVRSIDPGC